MMQLFQNPQALISFLNFIVCAGIFWACICRLNARDSKKYLHVRARYTLLLGAAFLSALQSPLLGQTPSIACLVFAICVFIGLFLNIGTWLTYMGTKRRCENR